MEISPKLHEKIPSRSGVIRYLRSRKHSPLPFCVKKIKGLTCKAVTLPTVVSL